MLNDWAINLFDFERTFIFIFMIMSF